jgi:hypothetical protein
MWWYDMTGGQLGRGVCKLRLRSLDYGDVDILTRTSAWLA